MTPRRWENLAKYLFDMSKATVSIAVISHFVISETHSWKMIAMGAITGLLFFVSAALIDRRGDRP